MWRHQHTIFNLAYYYLGSHSEVEDVGLRIFAKIYCSLPKINLRQAFSPWFYRITINECHNELNRIRRQKPFTFIASNLENADRIETLTSNNEAWLAPDSDPQEIRALLQERLDRLPDRERVAILLRDLQVIPYAQIAEILNCTEQAGRLKVRRARARLKTLISGALRNDRESSGLGSGCQNRNPLQASTAK